MTARLLAVFAFACLYGVPAFAQTGQCGSHAVMAQTFEERFGEEVVYDGVSGSGTFIIELFVNAETKTFSVLITDARGYACMVAAGKEWQPAMQGGGL